MTIAYLLSAHFLDDTRDGVHTPPASADRAVARQAEAEADRDRALTEALSGSDETRARAALDAVVTAYFDRLARFVYGLVMSVDIAEDVVQDVLVRVWDARHAVRPEQSLRAYLFTAVRRRALDVLKHHTVEVRHASTLGLDTTVTLAVDDQLDSEAVAHTVRLAITQLSERRQTALRLRYEEGLPFALVAEVMGISEKAAKDLTARAVREIRASLGV